MKLVSCPIAIQVYNGANVVLHIKGENELIVPDYDTTDYGSVGLIHIGYAEKTNTGATTTYKPSKLLIEGDDRESSILRIKYPDKSTSNITHGADGIRASSSTGAAPRNQIPNNKLTFANVNIEILNIADSNRGICGDTYEELFFDTCKIKVTGGNCISGGMAWSNNESDLAKVWSDIHFRNCTLDLKGSNPDYAAIAVQGGGFIGKSTNPLGFRTDGVKNRLIFCDMEDNTAIILGEESDIPAVKAPIVEIAGGAVQITHDTGYYGILTDEISIQKSDKDRHPIDGTISNIMFYVDKIGKLGDPTQAPKITVADGTKVIISEPTAGTKPQYLGDPLYPKTGNVWGDLEIFNAQPDVEDYVIKTGEQIIVQYDPDRPNTIGIRPDAELTIEKGGRLVIEPGPFSNVNDGAIVLKDGTMTKEQIVKMIKDWGFEGTGIIKTPIGTFDNSGAEWGDIVDNTDPAQASKLTGGPNMIVTGKDANGRSVLVAVNPSTKDEAYTVPANQKLDTKLFVTDPADPTHKTLSPMYDGVWTSAVVYPLNADGSVPQDINTATAKIGPMPTVKIESSKAGFSLSVDDIAELRRYAKDNNMDTFVIWVYETNGKDDREYKTGSPIKFPFVFRVDSPEHQLHTIVMENPGAQDRITQGDNLVVLNTVPQAGAVAQQRFVSINPTRADAPHVLPEKNSLALDIYIATEDKNYRVDSNSAKYESKKVKASLRPYDGLTPEQYKSLNDYVITKGPSEIVGGYANFEFDHKELFRWAHRHRLDEFVIYIYDEETNGGLVSREFVFRMSDADTGVGGAHCSGCDALGAPLFALALALSGAALMRRGKR